MVDIKDGGDGATSSEDGAAREVKEGRFCIGGGGGGGLRPGTLPWTELFLAINLEWNSRCLHPIGGLPPQPPPYLSGQTVAEAGGFHLVVEGGGWEGVGGRRTRRRRPEELMQRPLDSFVDFTRPHHHLG